MLGRWKRLAYLVYVHPRHHLMQYSKHLEAHNYRLAYMCLCAVIVYILAIVIYEVNLTGAPKHVTGN